MAWNLGSRFTLLTVNVLTFVFSVVLLSYGVEGFTRVGHTKVHKHVTNPFAVVISMATLMMVLALLGICGGCCAVNNDDGTPGKYRIWSNRGLAVYFSVVMIVIAGLMYGVLLCFIWSDKAEDIIDTYWVNIKEVVPSGTAQDQVEKWLRDNATGGGVICLVMMGLSILCAHCSAILMGYKYTARKSVLVINMMGGLLGLVTIIIAFLPSIREVGVKNSWLPEVIGTLGIITLFFAFIGFYGAFRLNTAILLCNAVFLSVLAVLFLGFGIFCLADAEDAEKLLKAEWEVIRHRFIDVCPGLICSKMGNGWRFEGSEFRIQEAIVFRFTGFRVAVPWWGKWVD
mmetsp:Transcript_29259/g.45831  ORF Transcript_29259/g.45831 Transcript_29259/m.45831 type:complete len:342 (-) Transcript_29259:607-1632(-)